MRKTIIRKNNKRKAKTNDITTEEIEDQFSLFGSGLNERTSGA